MVMPRSALTEPSSRSAGRERTSKSLSAALQLSSMHVKPARAINGKWIAGSNTLGLKIVVEIAGEKGGTSG